MASADHDHVVARHDPSLSRITGIGSTRATIRDGARRQPAPVDLASPAGLGKTRSRTEAPNRSRASAGIRTPGAPRT
jgi:hypothetical protein